MVNSIEILDKTTALSHTTPVDGMTYYDKSDCCFYVYYSSSWNKVAFAKQKPNKQELRKEKIEKYLDEE